MGLHNLAEVVKALPGLTPSPLGQTSNPRGAAVQAVHRDLEALKAQSDGRDEVEEGRVAEIG